MFAPSRAATAPNKIGILTLDPLGCGATGAGAGLLIDTPSGSLLLYHCMPLETQPVIATLVYTSPVRIYIGCHTTWPRYQNRLPSRGFCTFCEYRTRALQVF